MEGVVPTNTPLNCPRCGKQLKEVLSKAAPNQNYKCLNCDGVDPLETKEIQGWLKSELAKASKPPDQ